MNHAWILETDINEEVITKMQVFLERRVKLVKRKELLASTTSVSEQNDTICMSDLKTQIFTVF
jgi:hypothetical protein